MSYQEKKYNQNGKFNRNSVGPVPTLSSDISIFNRPSYIMSGATSIECPYVTCNINDVPYNDIFTGTTDCFTVSALSGSCFNSIDWITNVYEDSALKYSKNFYSSTEFTGPIIDVTTFSGSVVTAFDTLKYDYTFDGTGFTVTNNTGLKNLTLELTTELDYDINCPVTGNTTGFTSCSCPAGYTATTANNVCKKVITTASTYNGAAFTVVAGDTDSGYAASGAHFWPSLDNLTLPLYRHNGPANTLHQGSSGGPIVTSIANVSSNFWGKFISGNDSFGRLNNGVGVKSSSASSEWVGFSSCVNIPTTGTYYIGIAGDQYFKFRLNGDEILLGYTVNNSFNWGVWHMIPLTLYSGINVIEMEGKNAGGDMSFGAEIYSADTATLISATSIGDTGLIFSTNSEIGGEFDLGTTVGYSCPSNYALNTCDGGTPVCSKIETSSEDCVFTGSCETKQTVCNLDFSGITLNDDNVHVLTGQTEFNLTFDFTGNTSSFIDNNAKFKYNIHKYVPGLNRFNGVPVYSSEYINWSGFSGTSAYTTSITASTIDPDGEYIIKGQFNHDVSTEFGKLLGYNYTTVPSLNGDPYGIYQSNKDKYFIAFKEADTPALENGEVGDGVALNGLTVLSVLLDGTTTEFNLPLSNGAYLISLNGITLSPEYDYSITQIDLDDDVVSKLTLSAQTFNEDILTYAFTNGIENNNVKADSFDIASTIVSGATNQEGANTVYYNTTKGKYELYLSRTPITSNDIVITLNGITLANNVDYFQSNTNSKRIILEGDLIISDLLTAYYNTSTNIQGNQFGTGVTVSWSIQNAPINNDGLFTVQTSNDNNFTSIVSSGTTSYIAGQTSYGQLISLVGTFGDKQYYRIKNEKRFKNLCGETLTTEKYSETVEITIQTNLNNSY
jgi:hypothetical protein